MAAFFPHLFNMPGLFLSQSKIVLKIVKICGNADRMEMHVSRLLLQTEAAMGGLGVKGALGVLSALMIMLANTRNYAWTTDMSVQTNNRMSFPSLSIGNRLLGMVAHACSQVKQ